MDAYGKRVEAVCSDISPGMQFHRFLNRDIFSWSCIKAVGIKPRLFDLKVASLLSFTISVYLQFNPNL